MSMCCWKDGEKFSPRSLFFNSGYYKAIHDVTMEKKIIKFHFENVKTKCFGISEVKHFIKNAASECFDIFKIHSPPPPIFSA